MSNMSAHSYSKPFPLLHAINSYIISIPKIVNSEN